MITRLALALVLGCIAFTTHAQIPLLTGPQDPSAYQATINELINQINALPAQQAFPGAPVIPGPSSLPNSLMFTPAPTGLVPFLGINTLTSDANTDIGLAPIGSGNIVLFGPPAQGSNPVTGILQFANAASFIPAPGLAVCPGTT